MKKKPDSGKNGEYQDMTLEVLGVLNDVVGVPEAVQRVMEIVKRRTGMDAVAIRLARDNDFPFVAHAGFPREFLETENSLCSRGVDGKIEYDAEGKPRFECVCGVVLEGRTRPGDPLFSPGGSCWTHDARAFQDLSPARDPRHHPRNVCLRLGFKSIAIVPIRSGLKIVGLLQLNDKRPGRFTPARVAALEGVAASIGIALARILAEEERRRLQVQLSQSQKLEALALLAGGVAHDFGNNMFCIRGYVEVILGGMDPGSPLRHAVEQIQLAAQDGADLARQLLALSRKQTNPPKPTDVDELISSQKTMLHRIMGGSTRIKLNLRSGNVPAMVDPPQFQQVLVNLCINARDAMPQGGSLTIESEVIRSPAKVNAEGVKAGKPFVRVSVRDTGTGMPPEVLSRIFEPFFSTKEAGKGTGLGLPVVLGIVQRHGGWIDTASQPGKGSCFDVHFPCPDSVAVPP